MPPSAVADDLVADVAPPVASAVAAAAGTVARDRRRPRWPPLGLAIPACLVVAAMLLPLAYLLIRGGSAGPWAVELLTAPATLRVLANSAVLVVAVTFCSLLLAVPLAWLTTRTDLPGRRIWAVVTALPLCIPTFVGGFAFVAALGPRGMLQSVLAPLGVDRLPELYGLPGAVLVLTLFSYPYVLLTVRAGLLGLDPALEEASRGLGSTPSQTFRRVTLPQLRPAAAAGCLLVALYTLSDFGAVSLLRYDSFTRAIYVYYRSAFDRTPAAVLALVLVAFTVVLLAVETRARGRASHAGSASPRRSQRPVPLGRWRIPALVFCATVALLGLGLPLGVMTFWLVRGVAAGEPLAEVVTAAGNSLRASGIAAGVAATVALPLAVLGARYRGTLAGLIERATALGYALPGIVVAVALVFFGARFGGPLYQTLALLVFAYVVRFLPQAVGATRTSVLQVPPSVEEASRGLGRGRLGTLWHVTTPLVRPGVLAGAALVFLTAMKELPATLLLGPTGYPTLATQVWSATSEAFFARAAAPALVLIVLTSIPLAVLLTRRGLAGTP